MTQKFEPKDECFPHSFSRSRAIGNYTLPRHAFALIDPPAVSSRAQGTSFPRDQEACEQGAREG